eukprot:CAMPEP_0202458320 /NCGR_PEP_ID=MMETSP1360-20130828/24469_1 /ASSEMBLY_ACC=CAM_ASM_000848 /TAXON_ID=515479 /ORGANISM="Licmophora paradoxa, Strain CCMP2313" /LENGTH=202 /DNA_ID=CAMNT_0049078821 /DNA_START=103 /DNA_END=711 /DNA_ORIENTATION=+
MPIRTLRRQHSLIRFFERVPSAEFVNSSIHSTKQVLQQRVETPNNNKNKNNKNNKKTVQFFQSVEIRPCLHANDYTEDEYTRCWYSEDDFHGMKRERRMTLRLVKSIPMLPKSMTRRGLESRTKIGDLESRAYRLSTLMAVINEQTAQKSKRVCDAEAIRLVSLKTSEHCVAEAVRKGKEDEQDLQQILKDDIDKSWRVDIL